MICRGSTLRTNCSGGTDRSYLGLISALVLLERAGVACSKLCLRRIR
jgi:hypothetical protein